MADGLDGVVARKVGSTAAGPYLDSLADVASFGVAPALVVTGVAREAWTAAENPAAVAAGYAAPALFVAMAVVRLGLYTAYDSDADETQGVQTTLAATVLSAGVLAGVLGPAAMVGLAALLAVLMSLTVTYPDLHPQDVAVMGAVQALAVVLTGRAGEVFAFALLFLSLAYLFLGPRFYWR
jgi:CDP-diacylglycerol--serine O-phosphatidyltransferase